MRDTKKGAKIQEIAKKENLPITIIPLDVDKPESIKAAINQRSEEHTSELQSH